MWDKSSDHSGQFNGPNLQKEYNVDELHLVGKAIDIRGNLQHFLKYQHITECKYKS